MYSASLPGGAMIDHSEFAEIIDGHGHIRYLLNTDPGAATVDTKTGGHAMAAAESVAANQERDGGQR